MKRLNEPPCVVFAQIDVTKPDEVAKFIWWLIENEWPGSPQANEEQEPNWREAIESFWGWDAPRRRMAKLLWQLLQENNRGREFHSRFTLDLALLEKDSERCAQILPPIQQRLRWVLTGIEQVYQKSITTGQINWGEEWFLPKPQADYVRQQLQKTYPTLLEKASDYQEVVQASLDFLVAETARAIEPPLSDPNRIYVGELTHSGSIMALQPMVWVESENGGSRCPLPNAQNPYSLSPGSSFGWGYGGSGSKYLAISILADALDGDLELARELHLQFLETFILPLPQDQPFRIRRMEVIDWLRGRGITDEDLKRCQQRAKERRERHASKIERWESVLKEKLYAQRFDVIPTDFESALYLDLWQMLQSGKRILRCNWCKLPIPCDGSPRSNRQRARWEKGDPIYHERCHYEAIRKRKQDYWKRISQDPDFRERRRVYARERRRLKSA